MKHIYLTVKCIAISLVTFCQWTNNVADNLEIAAQSTADLQSLSTSDGKTWIAYYHNNAGNYDMRAQLLDVNGNKLLGANGVLVSGQPSGSATYVFTICLDANGNLIIAYQYQVSGVNTAVVSKVQQDGSLPWGASGIQLGAGLSPFASVLTNGETIVAWNNTTPPTLYMQKISAAGAVAWTTPVPVLVGTSNSTRGQVIPNPGGKFTLVFQRKGVGISTTLYAQRYSSEGVAAWAAPLQISTLTTSGARFYSGFAENDTTYFGFYASSGSRFLSYVQRINPDGTIPWGTNGTAFSTYSTGSDPYQQTTNIASTPGSPYVWAVCTYSNTAQSQYGVYVQKFAKATGARLLDPLGKEVFPISTNFDTQAGALSLFNDAPVFMSYDANYKIYATRLNGTGDFVWPGNRVVLSSTTAGGSTPKGRFAFTYMNVDNAVAVWYDNRGVEYRAYAQNITSAGLVGLLPVKLGDFTAARDGKSIKLAWRTYTEHNSKGFELQKSADGVNFITLQFITTKATNGSSNTPLDYNLVDIKPFAGDNFYRLIQEDINGSKTYSKVVLVKEKKQPAIAIDKVFTRDKGHTLHIEVTATNSGNPTISLIDLHGKLIKQQVVAIQRGSNIIDFPVAGTSKGIYIIKLQDGQEQATAKWMNR